MTTTATVGLIILAAGQSQRLGKPKQLLPYGNGTLLSHIVDTALASMAQPVVVVTGFESDQMQAAIGNRSVTLVINQIWPDGVGSSIAAGVNAVAQLEQPPDAVLITTVDQPHVSTALLYQLIEKYGSKPKRIVACEYDDSVGVPALFDKCYYPQLMRLDGDQGAKSIIEKNQSNLVTVPFPEGAIDIDRPRDLNYLG